MKLYYTYILVFMSCIAFNVAFGLLALGWEFVFNLSYVESLYFFCMIVFAPKPPKTK